MPTQFYRIIEHPADTGFEVKGNTRKKLFETAARAFFDIMWSVEHTGENEPYSIEVRSGDINELMVNFLEEFLYLFDAKGLVSTDLKIESFSETKIIAKVWLHQFNNEIDQELLAVKAVTYHQLFIGRKDNQWVARVFLDI
ncbi:MAG: archease [Deltaproteobacteria bacterium]|jgi:SHS2 domain-containing protein|nr:archease [Deltaproteobacteria bacterium]